MSLIKRLNKLLFGVIMLAILCVSSVFWFSTNDNKKVDGTNKIIGERGVFEYRKGLSGKINLGTVNGVAITNRNIAQASQYQEDLKESKMSELLFIGGELEGEKREDETIRLQLKELAEEIPSPAVLTGNLIRFKKQDQRVLGRISDIKKTLSSSFGEKFNISFGDGDVACGDDCINGWGEVLFGEKIKTRDLLFAHSFEYGPAKVLLLEPEFFIDESKIKINWLEKELSENKQKNLIVVSNNSMSDFGVEKTLENKHKAKMLFEEHGVDLVVFGDQDKFSHEQDGGVTYISSANFKKNLLNGVGDTSFIKLKFNENEMNVFTYNKKQEIVDEFKIK